MTTPRRKETVWTKDQAGNVIEFDYDQTGRNTHRRVSTLASGDGAIRRISTVYDDLGRVGTVTQYDDHAVGEGAPQDEVKYTYADWGPIAKFEQDHDSTVATGGSRLYDIEYTYSKATLGRRTIRRTALELPDGSDVTYTYSPTGGLHDDEASRVTQVKVVTSNPLTVADYRYNGMNTLVGIDYPGPDVFMHRYGSSSGSYPNLDRFNRVTSSVWTKDLATDRDFYDVDIAWDRNSNITLIEDNVHTGFDVSASMDGRNRLTEAEEGTWGGSSITNLTRMQQWTLDQLGNWDFAKLDLDGIVGSVDLGIGEYEDDRVHNDVNELKARDVDDDSTVDFEPVWNKLGQLADDDEHYEYEHDAFGRLRWIRHTDDQSVIAEYRYSGLGYLIGIHQDTDTDGDVDSSDTWRRLVYDIQWRVVAVYEDDDSDPVEQYVYHAAGLNGHGTASFLDAVILRDRDTNGDGGLEERIYYCQNWRNDVVVLIDDVGGQIEQARYSAYGIPFGLPAGDCDSHGAVDAADVSAFDNFTGYDVRGDLDLDGDNDNADRGAISSRSGDSGGWRALSLAAVSNSRGYAGYTLDAPLSAAAILYHVRHRVLHADLGRWLSRDPIGYVDGMNLYGYASANPVALIDPFGLSGGAGGDGGGGGAPGGGAVLPWAIRLCIVCPSCCPVIAAGAAAVIVYAVFIADDVARRPVPSIIRVAPGYGLLPEVVDDLRDAIDRMLSRGEPVDVAPPIAPPFSRIKSIRPRSRDKPEGRDCHAHFVACLATRLADKPGSVHGQTRCGWCYEACLRSKAKDWPITARTVRGGNARCDYWNYNSVRL